MLRKLCLVLCLVGLACLTAYADIPFSGSGSSGTIAPGQPFTYDADGAIVEGDWGVPGVGSGILTWTDPTTIHDFEITFTLGSGTILDPAQVIIGNMSACAGSSGGGTTFCSIAGSMAFLWTATLNSTDTGITFVAPAGGDLVTGDTFFTNIFFSGPDPNGAAFSGAWTTGGATTPEPSSLLLLGSGVVGFAELLRRKRNV